MEAFLDSNPLEGDLIRYISDVINYYTPEITPSDMSCSNWYDVIYRGDLLKCYGFFIMSLLNLSMQKIPHETFRAKTCESDYSYSLVTLNYDRIPEMFIEHIRENFGREEVIDLPIYKLHGCVEKGNIVPPTWNKGNQSGIEEQWKGAFQELKSANHIRIIGYSLPESDSYIKYLLKSAIAESKHLKSLDVICFEKGHEVKNRYQDFIRFNKFRYKNADIVHFLQRINYSMRRRASRDISDNPIWNNLELHYDDFMR